MLADAVDQVASSVARLVDEPGLDVTDSQRRDALRKIQAAQDTLDALKAEQLKELDETKGYEADGASSLRVWCRNELRLDSSETRAVCAAASTMRQLTDVGDSARAGRIRSAHVRAFTYGVRHIGYSVVQESLPWLLDVATACEPAQLFQAVRALREAVYPDTLDDAWQRGMDREDFQVNAVPEGWHVNGFLNTVAGAKLRTILDSLGAPREGGDERTGSQRRVDALEELADKVLSDGLPSDKGIRPHLQVIVEAHTLAAVLGRGPHYRADEAMPAQLLDFGAIGPRLLSYLTCVSHTTAIITDGQTAGPVPQARILNVGRSARLATPKQRHAVIARQDGQCAAPGCTSTHLEVHHRTPWSQGGPTDLDNLIGLCPSCHRLAHRGMLHINDDGYGGFAVTGGDNSGLRSLRRPATRQYREAWRTRQQAKARREAVQSGRAEPMPHIPRRSPGHQRV